MSLSFEGDRKDAMAPGRLGLARDTVHTCRERASNGQSLGGGFEGVRTKVEISHWKIDVKAGRDGHDWRIAYGALVLLWNCRRGHGRANRRSVRPIF